MAYFPSPTNIKSQTEYVLYFDTPISLPKNPPTSISFEPASGSYSIQGSTGFVPKIFIKIKALHKIQTKTLLRLVIKDTKNNILYSDYLLIICSPETKVDVAGSLIPPGNSDAIGPNGGSVIRITDSTGSSSSIVVGSSVTGPGIPNTETFFVKSLISNTLIELNKLINFPTNQAYSGTFSFVSSVGCVDPTNLIYNNASSTYMALDYNNNWTYKVRNQVIVKFIPENPQTNKDTVILLPVKNTALLGLADSPQPIPASCLIKGGGRLISDTIPISDV